MKMRIPVVLGTLLLVCSLANQSCKPKVVNPAPEGELFVGTYVYRIANVVGAEKSDSLRLEITGNTNYFATFYPDSPAVDPSVKFCGHSGSVKNFGTNSATFTPSLFDAGNCDTLHIARGVFSAVFGSGGALTMKRIGVDTTFEFKLLKK
jgi:hypothetical protein